MSNRRLLVRLLTSLSSDARRLPDLSWITSALSVSGTLNPRHFAALSSIGIKAVVDLREEGKDDAALLESFGIRFLHLPTPDHWPPSQDQLAFGSLWATEQLASGRRTLIHCKEGIGRSIVLTCCVLIHQGHDPASALHLTKARRWGTSLSASQARAVKQFAALAGFAPLREGLEQIQAEQLTP